MPSRFALRRFVTPAALACLAPALAAPIPVTARAQEAFAPEIVAPPVFSLSQLKELSADWPHAVFLDRTVRDLRQMRVMTRDGVAIGSVSDVLSDQRNDARALVVGFGGFLGIMDRPIAIPVERLSLEGRNILVTDLSEAELRLLPEWNG